MPAAFRFAGLPRTARAVVLTPLFPAGIAGPDDIDTYRTIDEAGVRFDHVPLGLVDEVAHRWHVDPTRFFLPGSRAAASSPTGSPCCTPTG